MSNEQDFKTMFTSSVVHGKLMNLISSHDEYRTKMIDTLMQLNQTEFEEWVANACKITDHLQNTNPILCDYFVHAVSDLIIGINDRLNLTE